MQTWEEIRSNWVNGNRKDVKKALRALNKAELFHIISEALETHYQYLDVPQSTQSGDLNDLREILQSFGG